MDSRLKEFMERDSKELSAENNDYTFYTQAKLGEVLGRCAADTEFPLEEKDFDNSNLGWFANCVKNGIFMAPALNQNRTMRNLAGVQY